MKHFLLAAAVVAMTTAATADDGIWTISTPQADGKYPLRRDAAYQDDIITTHTRQARIRDDSHMGTVAGRYRGSPGVFSYGRRLYQAETNDRNPTAGFFRANGYAEFGVSGSKYRDNIFAYLIDSEANGKGEKSIMIVNQGKLSDTMPQSGEAAYLGDAFIGRHDDVTTGSARFTADFANKTLRGRIEPRERTITRDNANGRRIDAHSGATRHSGSSDYTISYATVNIDARIEGNGFTGGDQQPVRSKGHFYGANAAELGGIFHDTIQEVSGSFGAVKEGSRALPPAPTPQPKPSVIDTDNAGLWRISTTAADAAYRLPRGALQGDIIHTDLATPRIDSPAQMNTLAARSAQNPDAFRYGGRTYWMETGSQTAIGQNSAYSAYATGGDHYRYTRFGYHIDAAAGADGKRAVRTYHYGTLTPDMPAGGSAEYKGEAVLGRGEWLTTGHARLSADFAAKTLHGRIESEARTIGHQVADAYSGATRPRQPRDQTETIHFNPVTIDARIDGNAFSTGADSIVRSKDHFYGEGAAEVGGSFGAQKQ